MNYDQFQVEWIGKRVADPLLGTVGMPSNEWYQCVSLIKQYWTEVYGIVCNYPGNAIDIWTNTNATILTKFNRVGGSDAQQGDIVVFAGLPGNPYGHIGIATGNLNDNVEILEQNGGTGGGSGIGSDAIRTRYVSRSRVAGLLRPITVATAPVAPPQSQTCTYEDTTPRNLLTTKSPTAWWNLNAPNWDTFQPAAMLPEGATFPVGGIAHHQTGGSYYMTPDDFARAKAGDYSTNNGINTADLKEVPPPAPTPTPLPEAPVTAPSSEQYEVIKDLKGYPTANSAVNHINSDSDVGVGSYFVFNRFYDMINVTTVQGQPGAWINPTDNVPDPIVLLPAPTPPTDSGWEGPRDDPTKTPDPVIPPISDPVQPKDWRTTYKPFTNAQGKNEVRRYVVVNKTDGVTFKDYESKPPNIKLEYPKEVNISGTFVKDNILYLRPDKMTKQGLWFGAQEIDNLTRTVNMELYSDVYGTETTSEEREVIGSKTLTDYFWDAVEWLVEQWQKIFKNKKD